jgi:hypothetical protein
MSTSVRAWDLRSPIFKDALLIRRWDLVGSMAESDVLCQSLEGLKVTGLVVALPFYSDGGSEVELGEDIQPICSVLTGEKSAKLT